MRRFRLFKSALRHNMQHFFVYQSLNDKINHRVLILTYCQIFLHINKCERIAHIELSCWGMPLQVWPSWDNRWLVLQHIASVKLHYLIDAARGIALYTICEVHAAFHWAACKDAIRYPVMDIVSDNSHSLHPAQFFSSILQFIHVHKSKIWIAMNFSIISSTSQRWRMFPVLSHEWIHKYLVGCVTFKTHERC